MTKDMNCAEHFGLKCLIRCWFATAVRRRNFQMLAKAAQTAQRAGLSMDQIFDCEGDARCINEENSHPQTSMSFLPSLLLTPKESQQTTGPRLRWSELPEPLLMAAGGRCPSGTEFEMAEQGDNLSHLGSRWIFVRETRCGITRFFTSPAFERDIMPWATIDTTFKAGQKEVGSLFYAPVGASSISGSNVSKTNFLHCLAKQVSLHAKPGQPLIASKFRSAVRLLPTARPNLRVSRMVTVEEAISHGAKKGKGEPTVAIQDVDILGSNMPVSENQMFYYIELLLQTDDTATVSSVTTSLNQLGAAALLQISGKTPAQISQLQASESQIGLEDATMLPLEWPAGEGGADTGWLQPALDLAADTDDHFDTLLELLSSDSSDEMPGNATSKPAKQKTCVV
jgi:hypothetical protein